MPKWGFLRETTESANKAGIDKDTGLHRTGLNEYLHVIFPNINDWINDKQIGQFDNGEKSRRRPDYRSESLKLIVEFDGFQHYTNPDKILDDLEARKLYEKHGYKVVRIPYFIQLSNNAVKTLFGKDVVEPLFDETFASFGIQGRNSPAYFCPAGIKRMQEEFKDFPEQLEINKRFLESQNNPFLSGIEYF